MATSENILLKKASGHLGKQLVIKQYGDKTVLSAYPDMSKRKLSSRQLAVNETMAEANDYARSTLADPDLSGPAQVRLNVTRNKLYTSLIREFFANKKEYEDKNKERQVADH